MIRQYFENVNFFFFSEKQNKTYAAILIFLIFISSILEFIAISLLALFILFLSGKTELGIIDKFYIPNFITFENYSFFFVIIGFFIFKNIFVSFIEFNKSKFFATLFSKFHRSNMKNFLNLDYNIYKNVKSSEFSKKINFSSERTFIGIGESFFSLVNEIFIFFTILIILSISVSYYVFIGGLVIAFIYLILFLKIKSITKQLGNDYSNNATKIFANSEGIFKGFKEIRIFNKELHFIKFFENSILPFAKAWMLTRFILNILKYINETIIISLIVLGIILLKYFNVPFDTINFSFAAFAVAIIRLYPNLSKIQNTLTSITITLPVSNELKDFSNLILKESKNILMNKIQINETDVKNLNIKLDEIEFNYGDKKIVENINLKFEDKKKYFIYGPSGSGKTTLLELICGLLIPSNGKIAFYEKENFKKDINISELITYVPQEPYLVDSDFFDNVTMFDNKNKTNINKAKKALIDCGLEDLLNKQSSDVKSLIGENGIKLASGQKQRIGLARAFYKDRKIIVLDEPTSNLDKKTEELFMNNLINLSKDKILIFVSHNLNYCDRFDEIYLLKDGKIQIIENNNIVKLKELL